MSKKIKVSKSHKREITEEKLYVVTPIRESPDDEEFRVIGTKEDIANYVKDRVEFSFESRELRFKVESKQRLFCVEFHAGSRDGLSGFGCSAVCKTIKEAKEWMIKYLEEQNIDAPISIIYNIYPVYWVKKEKIK